MYVKGWGLELDLTETVCSRDECMGDSCMECLTEEQKNRRESTLKSNEYMRNIY